MKLADKYLPPLSNGEYTIHVIQSTETEAVDSNNFSQTVKEKDTFTTERKFNVLSHGFSVLQEDVFSVYPSENSTGNFSTELPFLVSKARTLPWLYGEGVYPWVALIAIGEGDAVVKEQDILITQLLSSTSKEVYFPTSGMPNKFVEEEGDSCHIVDMPLSLFRDIMPKIAETEYLCHSRYTDLSNTEEKVSGMDGFFSVVMGNRFIPVGKTTMHLVSMLGYPDYHSDEYKGYEEVRLVSLYHWSVFCEPGMEGDFRSVIENLNTKVFSGDMNNTLSQRGMCAKPHYTRAGDMTGSLYHSPLVPYQPEKIPQVIEPCYSGDSVLIYDKDKGLFDVTYSAAWQLGRILALSSQAMTKAVKDFRTQVMKNAMKMGRKEATVNMKPDYKLACRNLVEVLNKGEKNEANQSK